MTPAIVRIINARNDKNAGTGFLVKGKANEVFVLTCSHVIKDYYIKKGGWKPVRTQITSTGENLFAEVLEPLCPADGLNKYEDDIALLRFIPDDPEHQSAWKALELASCMDACDRRLSKIECYAYKTMGFTSEASSPILTHGLIERNQEVNGRNSRFTWLQLKDLAQKLDLGFSGAPLWHPESKKVLGMIVARGYQSGSKRRFGLGIPADVINQKLSNYLPPLDHTPDPLGLKEKSREYFSRLPDTYENAKGRIRIQMSLSEEAGTSCDSLHPLLKSKWSRPNTHYRIIADGGMGKTSALLHLGRSLAEMNETYPIPIFIPLYEYDNVAADKRGQFILDYIARYYFKDANSKLPGRLENWLTAPWKRDVPKALLLLDGYDEITSDRSPLARQIINFWLGPDPGGHQAQGVRVLLSSRPHSDPEWAASFSRILFDIPEEQIKEYLESKELQYAPSQNFLLSNTLLLSLYAKQSELPESLRQDKRLEFRKVVNSSGELLWNFLEVEMGKKLDQAQKGNSHFPASGQAGFFLWLFRHLLPYLGHEMEQPGRLAWTGKEGRDMIQSYFNHFHPSLEELKTCFKDCRQFWLEWENAIDRGLMLPVPVNTINKSLKNTGLIKVENEDVFSFSHQAIRDYLSARHIWNELILSGEKKAVPKAIRSRALPTTMRLMLGEVAGEHYYQPEKTQAGRQMPSLRDMLSLYRSVNKKEDDFAIWNIITIWKETRKGMLAGEDFSGLDLRGISFADACLSHIQGEKRIAACFEGAQVDLRNFISQGLSSITQIYYSGDGHRVIVAGRRQEQQILLSWDAGTDRNLVCLDHFHPDAVIAEVNTEKNTALEISEDRRSVREWDLNSGALTKTFPFPEKQGLIRRAAYSSPAPQAQILLIVKAPESKEVAKSKTEIWYCDAETGETARPFDISGQFPEGDELIFSFVKERGLLFAGSRRGYLAVWALKAGGEALLFHHRVCSRYRYPLDIYCGPAGREQSFLLLNGNELLEWDCKSKKCTAEIIFEDVEPGQVHRAMMPTVLYQPEEGRVFTIGADKTLKKWKLSGFINHLDQTNDHFEDKLACATYAQHLKAIVAWDEKGGIWQISPGPDAKPISIAHPAGNQACVSIITHPKEERLLAAYENGEVIEWQPQTGERIMQFPGAPFSTHTTRQRPFDISPCGEYLLAVLPDQRVWQWSLKQKKLIRRFNLDNPIRGIRSLEYHSSGEKFLLADEEGRLFEYSLNDGKALSEKGFSKLKTATARFHPSGQGILVSSGDGSIKYLVGEEVRFSINSGGNGAFVLCPESGKILCPGYESIGLSEYGLDTGKPLGWIPNINWEEGLLQPQYVGNGKYLLAVDPEGERGEISLFAIEEGGAKKKQTFRNKYWIGKNGVAGFIPDLSNKRLIVGFNPPLYPYRRTTGDQPAPGPEWEESELEGTAIVEYSLNLNGEAELTPALFNKGFQAGKGVGKIGACPKGRYLVTLHPSQLLFKVWDLQQREAPPEYLYFYPNLHVEGCRLPGKNNGDSLYRKVLEQYGAEFSE